MRVPDDHPLRLTHALLRPEAAVAAAEALRGVQGQAAVEGLIELVYHHRTAREAVVAIGALNACTRSIVVDALVSAVESPHASVRIAAIQSLHQRRAPQGDVSLVRALGQDESWLVRRAALASLADSHDPERWSVLLAATDPHWRVRHALIQVLLHWGETDAQRQEIAERLVRSGPDMRARGVRSYLHHRWLGRPPDADLTPEDPGRMCPFWDWDTAVLLRDLERMGERGRHEALEVMPFLLGHPDDRVRAVAVEALRARGQTGHLAEALRQLDEPRNGTCESVVKLLSGLDMDRIEAAARFVLHLAAPSPAQLAWALDQAGTAFPFEEEEPALLGFLDAPGRPSPVRRALARLAARWPHSHVESRLRGFLDDPDACVQFEALRGLDRRTGTRLDEATLSRFLRSRCPNLRAVAVTVFLGQCGERRLLEVLVDDPDAGVRACLAECLARCEDSLVARLQSDASPHVRAAALTPARAAELIEDPTRETSWHVLAKAARMMRVPLWELEPEHPWRPEEQLPAVAGPFHLDRPAPPHARPLGPGGLVVSPVGISGHYGLPVEGYVRAVEAGVNLLFWEPNYQTLTEFAARLSNPDRNALHFMAGTFEADGKRIRRDAERVLRMLRIDRIALFLLFWVQSWQRVAPDVREALERLKEKGLIATFGLSTHSRPLAVEAMEAGWDPVMVRHSAGHRGAEEKVFPRAVELETSIITFNNTCYGRLLKPRDGLAAPTAADCYRYTLAQPGVTACLSAPATLAQLEENLDVIRDPDLPRERRALLEAHGASLYREESIFRKLVRSL